MTHEPTIQPKSPLKQIEYHAPPAGTGKPHPILKTVGALLLLLVVGVGGYLLYAHMHAATAAKAGGAAGPGGASGRSRGGGGPQPVIGMKVRQSNLDLYLDGLGSILPLNTVTVRSRVDGAIDKIAYTEGQTVKQGDFLLEIDPRPYQAALEQAQGQLKKDQATKTNADWLVKQDEEALKTKAIAEQQLYTDTATRDQALGSIMVDQAAIDNAKLNLEYCHITSPINGRIGLKLVDIGNIVHASDTTGLAVITQLQPISMVFTLPEDVVNRVEKRLDAKTPVEVQAWDRDIRRQLSAGTVMAIDNQIDANSGTVKVKAQFNNTDNRLFPSEFVNARLLVQTLTDVTIAPTSAVQHGTSSTFAWVVGPDSTVKMQNITVGETEGDDTVVTNGLKAGDTVVTDGVDKLADGAKVVVHRAASGNAPTTEPTDPATTQPSSAVGGHKHRRAANAS